MRPSHRAAEDEKRIRDRNAKRNVSPGPGAYNPLVTEHGQGLAVDDATKSSFSTSAKAGKAQFMATSPAHGGDIATDKNNVTIPSAWQTPGMGDMNAYNPNVNREMAYDAKKTFQTQSKAGRGNFGGTEKRNLLLSNMTTKPPTNGWTGPVEDTPGPAAYTVVIDEKGREANMNVMSDGEKMKSSSLYPLGADGLTRAPVIRVMRSVIRVTRGAMRAMRSVDARTVGGDEGDLLLEKLCGYFTAYTKAYLGSS